jgi:hypothetical protein
MKKAKKSTELKKKKVKIPKKKSEHKRKSSKSHKSSKKQKVKHSPVEHIPVALPTGPIFEKKRDYQGGDPFSKLGKGVVYEICLELSKTDPHGLAALATKSAIVYDTCKNLIDEAKAAFQSVKEECGEGIAVNRLSEIEKCLPRRKAVLYIANSFQNEARGDESLEEFCKTNGYKCLRNNIAGYLVYLPGNFHLAKLIFDLGTVKFMEMRDITPELFVSDDTILKTRQKDLKKISKIVHDIYSKEGLLTDWKRGDVDYWFATICTGIANVSMSRSSDIILESGVLRTSNYDKDKEAYNIERAHYMKIIRTKVFPVLLELYSKIYCPTKPSLKENGCDI